MKYIFTQLILLSFFSLAHADALDGCYRKTYEVAPTGHTSKIPEGVNWIFSFKGTASSLHVTADDRPETCTIQFSFENLQGTQQKFSFDQINGSQDGDWGICYAMDEFRDRRTLKWRGYVTPNWNSVRLSYTGSNGKPYTSDWSRVNCP